MIITVNGAPVEVPEAVGINYNRMEAQNKANAEKAAKRAVKVEGYVLPYGSFNKDGVTPCKGGVAIRGINAGKSVNLYAGQIFKYIEGLEQLKAQIVLHQDNISWAKDSEPGDAKWDDTKAMVLDLIAKNPARPIVR